MAKHQVPVSSRSTNILITYVASPHPDSPPFTLPSNVNRIVIHQLRQNWSEGKPVRECSYQDAGQWGPPGGIDDDSVAYAPGIANGDLRLCLRMAFNTDTLNKGSCCYTTLQNLIKDAKFCSGA